MPSTLHHLHTRRMSGLRNNPGDCHRGRLDLYFLLSLTTGTWCLETHNSLLKPFSLHPRADSFSGNLSVSLTYSDLWVAATLISPIFQKGRKKPCACLGKKKKKLVPPSLRSGQTKREGHSLGSVKWVASRDHLETYSTCLVSHICHLFITTHSE